MSCSDGLATKDRGFQQKPDIFASTFQRLGLQAHQGKMQLEQGSFFHAQPGPKNAHSQTNVATKPAPHAQRHLHHTILLLY